MTKIIKSVVLLGLVHGSTPILAADLNWRLGVEAGPAWQSRNDVQIPGDTGTRFSLTDIVGSGPFPYARVELAYQINDKHSLRFLLAPLGYTESGVLSTDVSFAGQSFSHLRVREPIKIPDIPGYKTLKCDFHTHTVFSDGLVWPTVRAEEAWRNGLDAIAITDHLEYTPHKADIPVAHNRSYEIALPLADDLRITLIKGSEITRKMPPGHINAIFLKDVAALDKENFFDAIKAAAGQGAFIFYNHPGWKGQQEDGISKWYKEHTKIHKKGRLHGIEMVNGPEYYPLAHQWCIDKKLTMIGNSDVHNPMAMDYEFHKGEHRTMTLVFAKEKSIASIKEATVDGTNELSNCCGYGVELPCPGSSKK